MSKITILAGTTSKLVDVFIQDSSSTTGAGLTGLTSGSSGLTWYYYREGAGSSTVVSATSMTLGTFTSSGFIVVDGTNMPGVYQLGVPNAAIAAGAKSVVMLLKGATNMAPLVLEIELTAVDNQDAVRGGMTALPNAAAEAAGGLYTRGTGAGQINQDANGRVDTNTKAWAGTATTLTGGLPDVNTKTIAAGIIAAATFAANALDAVWSTAARVLTAGTNIVLAKGVGVTGFNDPSAAANATELLDQAAGVETGLTVRQALRLAASALYGKASGLGTATGIFRDTTDTKNRITATIDADGNRTAVTLDPS